MASDGNAPPTAGATVTCNVICVPTVLVAAGATGNHCVVVAAGPVMSIVALTELGAFGAVPRYCAVTVREPVVVGTQEIQA